MEHKDFERAGSGRGRFGRHSGRLDSDADGDGGGDGGGGDVGE
jgi:hypothetical protein